MQDASPPIRLHHRHIDRRWQIEFLDACAYRKIGRAEWPAVDRNDAIARLYVECGGLAAQRKSHDGAITRDPGIERIAHDQTVARLRLWFEIDVAEIQDAAVGGKAEDDEAEREKRRPRPSAQRTQFLRQPTPTNYW